MVTLHLRHYAFGIALPILMAAVAYLQTNATPTELSSAQGQSAVMLQYVSIASTLVAGFLDMYKARKSTGIDPEPLLIAPPPPTTIPLTKLTAPGDQASSPSPAVVNVHVNPQTATSVPGQ